MDQIPDLHCTITIMYTSLVKAFDYILTHSIPFLHRRLKSCLFTYSISVYTVYFGTLTQLEQEFSYSGVIHYLFRKVQQRSMMRCGEML